MQKASGRFKVRNIFILIVLTTILLVNCRREQQAVVVATIDGQPITLLEFRLAYMELLKQPNVFDSRKLREQFLTELIDRRLLAGEARRRNLDQNEKLQAQVQAYYEKALREAHYKEVIQPKIKIDSAEAKAIYSYTRQQRKIKHLYFKTKAAADSAYQLLQSGYSWNELARQIFKNSVLAENGGDLGWVHWDQLEYDMAMTAFGQPKNTFSRPVKSTYGYHIILVEDLKMDPLITEEEYLLHQKEVFKLVSAKRGEKIARDYIEQKMARVKIAVNPKVLKAVGAKLETIFRRKPTAFDRMKTFQLTDKEIVALERRLWDLRNETLAYIDGRPLTVEKFIYALNFVPYQYASKSLKTALDFVLRDQVLTFEARSMGLEKKYPFVNLKKELYQNYLLQLALKQQIARSVKVNQTDVQAFLEKHRIKVKSVSLDSVRSNLKQLVKNEKRLNRITSFIDSLRQSKEIKRYPERIHPYYAKILRGR